MNAARRGGILLLLAVAALVAACDTGDARFEARRTAGLRSTPSEPLLSVEFTQIELGYGHTCGLAADGRAFCMGSNEYGPLGTSSPMQRCSSGQYPCSPTSLTVAGSLTFAQLGLDQRTCCGLATDGALCCWGSSASPVNTRRRELPCSVPNAGTVLYHTRAAAVPARAVRTKLTVHGAHFAAFHRLVSNPDSGCNM